MKSAIYHGTVRHRRHGAVEHAFTYPVGMLLLDLDELPGVLDGHPLWSARRAAPGRFRRSDYLGDPATPLADAVRDEVARQTGARPEGPVRLLTTPRTFGHSFNPVSFYYCHDAAGVLHSVVADVTNTPWGERHAYVMPATAGEVVTEARMAKEFHVSPFQSMEGTYRWRVSAPGEKLLVHIELDRRFDATLTLARRPLDRRGLTRLLARYPAATLRTVALIYANALRLKLKGAPYFRHPERA
jgi:DUF1365 family protein